ncbi:hypothetical protein A4F85_04710 [Delftia sp. GW456-R20]|uniref:hypothetical protein n=1 Tax=Delftia sp. GW456-R20 TaxID=1827145 RepID=UPI0007AEDDF6|nr:hypothetical protein [Delftia sp. GW456-R20]KZK32019.1 hypothetical protein A4F85_04710 [Delftia sp. GW456-R20]
MTKFKTRVLELFWLPAWVRACWRHCTGRFFIFRDASNEFLRWLWWVNVQPGAVSADVQALLDQAMDEIAARRRMGTWPC